jgi:hypothetical protein
MRKQGFFWLFFLLIVGLSPMTAQTAPNEGQTFYYKQTGVVRNNQKSTGDNTGQFITFTRKGCYDSDKNGIQAGDGFLAYQGIDKDIHIYNGDTYWGKAYYYFVKDFSRYNVVADGVIYVYEKTTPPANAVTSAKTYKKPEPQRQEVVIVPPVADNTTTTPVYNNGGSSSDNRSSSSSSRGTRLCDLCLGKGQTWVYTGSVGDNRTTVYCSVSGCNVTSPHRHERCNRCSGSGRLNL